MNEETKHEDMVECHYQGTIIHVPTPVLANMILRAPYFGAKYIRYKDAPKMYGISISTLKRLVEGTDVIFHPFGKGGTALIDVEKMDALMEYMREVETI